MGIRLLFIFSVLFLAGCGNADSSAGKALNASGPKAITTIQWIDSVKHLGKINEGQKLAVSFKFRNSGDKPLIIESVQPACGCTVADYPKEPIAPGSESEITGSFDSHGREGLQHKSIVVRANTASGEQTIVFEVEVVKKPGAEETN